jgi:hypothetical protein
MLYSRAHDIGFAHYPKTAGHTLTEWFRTTFPDAAFALPPEQYDISHLPVRESLERLGLIAPPPAARLLRHPVGRFVNRVARRLGAVSPIGRSPTRIIGVIREPFEMLVSLFEYWREFPFTQEPHDPFIVTARRNAFGDFLHAAVVRGSLWNYETFFDVNGPAWRSTRLLAFGDLHGGLAVVCREFGIPPPGALPQRNRGPSQGRDLAHYEALAGQLMHDVRHHYRWYYGNASRVVVRGDRSAS